ncbi:MAG: hypothetical protein JW803_08885 [Endomicrobiales bacterium]|nr:hypothetical protein [Endomicrobiales bacterium]
MSRTALSIYSPVVGGGENGLENPRTEFAINEKIWVTYDVKNITAVKEDGTSSFWLRQDLIIRDKKGNVVVVQPGVLDVKKPVAEKPARFVNEISLAGVEGLKPGRYEITLLVTDVISFKTVSETVFIKIK